MASEPATAVDRRDFVLAAALGLLAFAAYVRTLAPGLTADADSPMFQVIGRALGVAHNPGYPVYVLLTWPVAQIPIGTLAWRINLFSAAMGGLAIALTTIAARRLGCRRVVAAVAALGLAAGGTFWAQAVVAEVYTLHLALIAALLQSALAWRTSRRPRDFYAAVAWLAVGLGHHTTIAAFAPAIAALALLADWRFAVRLRTIATSAGLCALGLTPYLFVLMRSRDPQAYVESRATTLDGLIDVVLGGQFRDRLFTEPWRTIVGQRLPELVARVFRPDLTIVGLALSGIGVLWLLRRRRPDAALLLTGSAIVTAFVANYQVVDQHVFLLPVVLCLWLCAGVGLETVLGGVTHLLPALGATATRRGLVGAVALALPLWLALQHGPRVDRSGDRDDGRHVERLIAALPGRAAIAGGDFIVERMVHYQLRGADAGAGRDLRVAPRDAAAIEALRRGGDAVVAFPSAVDRLRLDGLDFAAAPVRLVDGPLDRVVSELPRGSIVALAVPAAHVPGFEATVRPVRARLGAPDAWASSVSAEHVAIAVVGGEVRVSSTPGGARLGLAPGEAGWAGRAPIDVEAVLGEAAVRAGGRDLVRTADGVAVAIWDPAGAFLRAFALIGADGYQVPLATTAFSAYPLIGAAEARDVTAGIDVDLTPLASTGSLTVAVPPGGVLTLDAFDAGALAPYVVDNRGAARVDVGAVPGGIRIGIVAGPVHEARLFLTLGAVADRLAGRLTAPAPAVARVRRVGTTGLLRGPDRRSAVVRMTRDDQALLVGAGWSAVEIDDAGSYRWLRAREGRLTIPPTSTAWRRLAIQAFRAAERGPATLAVRVDGVALEPRPLQPGWQTCAWDLPPAFTAALGRAPAELYVVVAGDPPVAERTVAVASLRFTDAN